ncbi:MAG: hypothetical protein ABI954_11425 [Pyrinomonadaceae bacterium]
MSEIIGWVSSLILLLTVGKQVHKQWKDGTSEGVSKWLFFGQIAASIGFLVYSVLITNWVFIVTNSLMVINSLVGIGILFYHRQRDNKKQSQKLAVQN